MPITFKQADEPDRVLHSFEEVAEQLGCGIGDLRREIGEARHPGLVGGLQAIAVEDFERLQREQDRPLSFTPALYPGFPGVFLFDEAWRALRFKEPMYFEDEVNRRSIANVKVEALTDEGRDYALTKLKHLADEKPPAGLGASGIADWRDTRRHERENAQVAAAPRRPRPSLNPRRRPRDEDDEASAA